MSRSLVVLLPLSLTLHLMAVAAVLTLVPPGEALSTLLIDLTLAEPVITPTPPRPPAPRRADPVRSRPAASATTSPPVVEQAPAPAAAPTASERIPDPPATPPEERVADGPSLASPAAVLPLPPPTGGLPAPLAGGVPDSVSSPVAAPVAAGGTGRAGHERGGVTPSGSPDGSHGAPRTVGLAISGGGGDSPGSEYGPYLAGLRKQIAESLRYPMAARRRRLTGTVHLEIVIQANGAIGAADVVQSSSHAILDEAALDTVKGLPPLPFPPDLPPRRLRVRLPVIFTLE